MEQRISIRTIILLPMLLLGFALIQAQSYHALPDSNATWITHGQSSAGVGYGEYELSFFQDDTVIKSMEYHKVFVFDRISGYRAYAGAFRSDSSGRTYYVPIGTIDTVEYLWYDFSKIPGDTVWNIALNEYDMCYGAYNLIVDSIKTLSSGPYDLKCMFLHALEPEPPGYNGTPLVWVEKIGSLNGGIFNMYNCGLQMTTLRCMDMNDTTLYFAPDQNCGFSEPIALTYEKGICELPPTYINDQHSQIPVLSAHPNPFATTTTIEYELTEPSQVWFTIYNAIGKVVYQAEDREMPAGSYKISWSPGHLPIGMYYAVMRSDEGRAVVKIVKH